MPDDDDERPEAGINAIEKYVESDEQNHNSAEDDAPAAKDSDEVSGGLFGAVGQLGKNTWKGVRDSWKTAKEQGDAEELKRLEKKIRDLKKK